MYFFYIDESGAPSAHHDPLRNGGTPLFCLSALALNSDAWHEFDRAYLYLKREFFYKEIGTRRAEYWEIKGSELTGPHNRASRLRQVFLSRVLELCANFGVTLFSAVIIKDSVAPSSTASLYGIGLQILGIGLQILTERFQAFLEELPTPDAGIMIIDSRASSLDEEVAIGHLSYVFGNDLGRTLDRVLEAPLFASSRLTVGIQVSDIIGSCIYAYYYQRNCSLIANAVDYTHIVPYWPSVRALEFKSEKFYDGYARNGFRIRDISR